MDEMATLTELVNPGAEAPVKAKKSKRDMAKEIEQSQITVNKSLPIPAVKPAKAKTQSYFQVAPRAICTCGEVMARPREIPNGEWSCMRILTGNRPSEVCQSGIPGEKIVAEIPAPKPEDAEFGD